jgi:hypothetical protein
VIAVLPNGSRTRSHPGGIFGACRTMLTEMQLQRALTNCGGSGAARLVAGNRLVLRGARVELRIYRYVRRCLVCRIVCRTASIGPRNVSIASIIRTRCTRRARKKNLRCRPCAGARRAPRGRLRAGVEHAAGERRPRPLGGLKEHLSCFLSNGLPFAYVTKTVDAVEKLFFRAILFSERDQKCLPSDL